MKRENELEKYQNICENCLNIKSNCNNQSENSMKSYLNQRKDSHASTKKYETIELPNGILYNIKSKETTTFKKDSMFKYINDNPKSTLIPKKYTDNYVTEFNYNGQTPLMYSVLINNVNFVKTLLKFDVGKVDDFNKSALDYAYEFYNQQFENLNDLELKSLCTIIQMLEEYEYHE